jgi:hypothetical protein
MMQDNAIRMIAAALVAFVLGLLALVTGLADKFHNLIW